MGTVAEFGEAIALLPSGDFVQILEDLGDVEAALPKRSPGARGFFLVEKKRVLHVSPANGICFDLQAGCFGRMVESCHRNRLWSRL